MNSDLLANGVPGKSFRAQGTITDTVITASMASTYEKAFIYFNFYSSDSFKFEDLVVPSAGTVSVTSAENGAQYGAITNGDDIDITTDYLRPNFIGPSKSVKCVPTGIAGATHYELVVVRY